MFGLFDGKISTSSRSLLVTVAVCEKTGDHDSYLFTWVKAPSSHAVRDFCFKDE